MAKQTGPSPFARSYQLDSLGKTAGVQEITSAPAVSFDNIPIGQGLDGQVLGTEWRQVKGKKNPVLILKHESGTQFAIGINSVTATALTKLGATISEGENWDKILPNIDKIKNKYLLVVNLGKLEDKKYHNLRVFCSDKPFDVPAPAAKK